MQQQQQNTSTTSVRDQEESDVKHTETKSLNNEDIFDDYDDYDNENVKKKTSSDKISPSEVASVADYYIEESNEFQNPFNQRYANFIFFFGIFFFFSLTFISNIVTTTNQSLGSQQKSI